MDPLEGTVTLASEQRAADSAHAKSDSGQGHEERACCREAAAERRQGFGAVARASTSVAVDLQFGRHVDGAVNRPINRAFRLEDVVGAFRPRRPFGVYSVQGEGDVDPPDHEDPVLHFHLPDSYRFQLVTRRTDPARLQRAPKGAEQSTAGGRDEVVDRRGVRVWHVSLDTVVTGDCAVRAETHRLGFRR